MLHLHRTGTRDGAPYVLLHGIGGEHRVWDPVLDALAARFDVLALDLPGFGRSAALPAGVTPTPVGLARAVAQTLDALEVDTAHVAGNSLGGWVALELAKAGRARTVVGVCPAGLWGGPLRQTGNEGRAHRAARQARALLPGALAVPRVRHLVLSAFVAHPERVPYRDAVRLIDAYARASAYDATSAAMRSGHFTGGEQIDVPVTLAFGERDRLIRPARGGIPGAEVVVLPGCGHVPMWDDTAQVAAVLVRGTEARRLAA